MSPLVLTFLVAVLAFVAIGGLGLAFVGGEGSQARALKRAQALTGGGVGAASPDARAKAAQVDQNTRRKQILNTLKEQDRQARKLSLSLEARLQQAGLSITVPVFWIISAVVGVVVAGGSLFIMPTPLLAVAAGFAATLGLPRWVVGFLGGRRLKQFTAHFADAIDVIVRGLKSGLPIHETFKIIGRESPQPVGGEFVTLADNLAMGLTVDQAMEKMYTRTPTAELRFFTIVLNIQQKTGGNLAEALGNLSQVLRARRMMREKIKALSSEAIASACIIGALPPGVVVLVTVTTPSYMSIMFTDPRGNLMLMGGVFWMAMGIFVMRKMINFKF